MRRRAREMTAPLLALGTLLFSALSGCISAPHASDGPPPDFAVSVTVADRARTAGSASPDRPRALRLARYIVEPDGLLRASVGPGSTTTTFPPPMRNLSTDQVADLWSLVNSAGYLKLDASSQSAEAETIPSAVTRTTALIYVAGSGERRSLQVPLESPAGVPTRALVDRLAELSWIREAGASPAAR